MSVVLAPASFAWLLRHELRLALRGTGTRRRWLSRAAPLLLLAAIPVALGIAAAIGLALLTRDHPQPLSAHAVHQLRGFLGAGILGVLILMISTAALGVLRTFHDRGDLDLLLSAPLPPARVLGAKAVGVAVSVAAPFVLLTAPFALTSAVLGAPRWLGLVAMVAVDATLATAAGLVLVGATIAAIGPRPARVAVQLGAALTGAAAFLLSQAQSLAPDTGHRVIAALARPWPTPLDWPARAALGAPLPLAALTGLAAAAAWGSAGFAGRFLAASESGPRRAAPRTKAVRFHAGLTRIVVAKELRLIVRDPELISQIALRLVYLIPAAALLLRSGHGVDPGPAIAGGATAFAALLAASLAWIVVAAEDAPDLIAAAPHSAGIMARTKLIAACLVPVAFVAVAAAAAGIVGAAPAWAAAVTLAIGTAAAITAALLQAWFGKPAARSAFRRRQQGSFVIGVGEIALAGAWAGTASLLVRGSAWAAAPAVLAGMIVAGAIEARRTSVGE